MLSTMSAQNSLGDEVERIDGNVNGLFAKVSDLADRVDDLEEGLARLVDQDLSEKDLTEAFISERS
jgi:hypothetical protein